MNGTSQPSLPELNRGTQLVACRGENRLPGEVFSSSHGKVVLQFSDRIMPPFEVGEVLELNYWDDENTLHILRVEVLQVGGYGRQIEVLVRHYRMEKRKHRRFEVSVPVVATVVQARQADLVGRQFESETKDISLGGLLTETPLSLTLGDQLEVELELSPDDRLCTRVWVVRSKMERKEEFVGAVVIRSSNWLGLEFQLSPEDQLRLLQFLLKTGRSAASGEETVSD